MRQAQNGQSISEVVINLFRALQVKFPTFTHSFNQEFIESTQQFI